MVLIRNLDILKWFYRISASNAISAPLTWQQGDLRRPYPTDIEMRLGFLGKSDLSNVNGHTSQTQSVAANDFPKSSVGGMYSRLLFIMKQFLYLRQKLHITLRNLKNFGFNTWLSSKQNQFV